jgi:hypothetical protein
MTTGKTMVTMSKAMIGVRKIMIIHSRFVSIAIRNVIVGPGAVVPVEIPLILTCEVVKISSLATQR